MEEIDRLFDFYDGKKDSFDIDDLLSIQKMHINNEITDNELYIKTLRKYITFKEKFITLNDILSKKNQMLKEEYKVNVLSSLPMSNDMAITLASLLPLSGIQIESRLYNGILIEMYNNLINPSDSSFKNNLNSFINDYGYLMSNSLYDVLWHKNKYEDNDTIRNNMINEPLTIDDWKNQKNDEKCRHYLSTYGELVSFEDIKDRLNKNNKQELAKRTIWASKDAGDGLGYDILSFLDYINEFRFEVKTTRENDNNNIKKYNGTDNDSFSISNNEMNIMIQNPDAYNIMRVFTNSKMASNNDIKILYLRLIKNTLTSCYAELVARDFDGYERKYIFNNKYSNNYGKLFEFKK